MSSVFKLSIKGIRSFDPIETETIEFSKPLTLIVGSNGSGKTSIIECLRFATTGDLPPNSKGGAFIHDPNIGGEKSVIAQIKLAFNNINNKNMILTKTLQLINKKTSNTFKTLGNQLVVLNNGERVTISTKAADVEQLVPQFLGVTKSILNYVIFCHQEDSLWPISEPAVLKKRFDEIFDSVKFIKVLDNFKDLRKQFNEDIKLLTNNVDHLKQERRRANSKKAEKELLEGTIVQYKEEINLISEQIEDITTKLDELFKSNQDYELVINKMESLQQQNVSLKNQITKLKDNIEFMLDSDSELQNKLTNFNEIQSQQRLIINNIKSQISDSGDTLLQKRQDYNTNIRLEGELKSLRTLNDQNMKERQSLMEQNNLGLMILEVISEEIVQEYKTTLQHLVSSNEKKLNSIVEENIKTKEGFEKNLLRIRDSHMKEEQHLKYYSEDIKSYKQTNEKIEGNLRSIKVDETELEIEREELDDLKKEFESMKKENKLLSYSSQISATNKQIFAFESDIDDLNHQISNSNKQNEVITRMQLIKEQISKTLKRESLLMDEHSAHFQQKVGQPLSIENGFQLLSETLNSSQIDIKNCHAEFNSAQEDHFNVMSQVKVVKDELEELKKELDLKLENIQLTLPEDVEIADYEDYMKDLQSDFDTISENISITEVTVKFNEAAINAAKKDHYCVLCRRSFEENQESKFLKMLEEHNEKIKSGKDLKERDQLKKELEEARNIKFDIARVLLLQDTVIEELTSKLNDLSFNVKEKELELKIKKDKLEQLQQNISVLENMKNGIRDLERVNQEKQFSIKELESLENELYGTEVKSITNLQEEQAEINLLLRKKRKELSDLIENKEDLTKQLSRVELKIKEKTLTIANKEKNLLDFTNLKRQQVENNDKIKMLTETLSASEKLLKLLDEELNGINEEFSKTRLDIEIKESEQREIFNTYHDLAEKLENYTNQISNYQLNIYPELEKCSENSKLLEINISNLEKEIDSKNSEVSNLERELVDADKTLRNIRDNIDIRSLETDLNKNLSIIGELEEQNARVSRENYKKEANLLNLQFSELKSQHLMKNGEILQLTKQVQSIDSELKKDYKNIDRKFNEEFLRLQTKFFVNNDLSVYSKALDTAIMKFHSLKMKEINEIIDQLWRTTYSGSDVDTILIKSESNALGVKAGNRSYNYRVVMIKQGVELDMRGRCSAGQKVLASIIIRLALLECFGINFGMITLDEPTTNLDEDNIESLAKSLNQIIEMRQKQKNFQLIVITHDEKFLKFMGAAKFSDLYYRVSRDERQTSVIELVPIAVIND